MMKTPDSILLFALKRCGARWLSVVTVGGFVLSSLSVTGCRLQANNTEKLDALKQGVSFDESGVKPVLSIAIAHPSTGIFIHQGNVAIPLEVSGTCSVNGVKVRLVLDGVEFSQHLTCENKSWSSTLDVSLLLEGTHSLQAVLTRAAGDQAESGIIQVIKDVTSPTVTLASPADNAVINQAGNSAVYALSGSCSEEGQSVNVEIDGVPAASVTGAVCLSEAWSATVDTTSLSEGAHTLSVSLSDSAGNASLPSQINFTKDTVVPVLTIVNPAASTYIHGASNQAAYAVDGTCDEEGASVLVKVDGSDATNQVGGLCSSGAWSATIDVNALGQGAHTISAVLSDAAGNQTSAGPIGITKDTVAPVVELRTPVAGSFIQAGNNGSSYRLSGSCDEEGASVSIQVDGVAASGLSGGSCSSGKWSATIDTTALASGSRTLTAHLTDSAGNTATPASVSVTKDLTLALGGSFVRSSVAYHPDSGAQLAANTARYRTIGGKSAVVVEEGTSNILSADSSSFEGGTVGNFGAILSNLSVVTSSAWSGTNSLKVDPTGTNARAQIRIDSGGTNVVSVNDTVTLTAYARLESGGPAEVSIALTAGGVGTMASTVQITSTEFTRISVTYTFANLGTGAYVQLYAGKYNGAQTTVLFDGIQLEKKSYATRWQVGGTDRTAETLTVPLAGNLTQDAGAVVMRVYFDGEMNKATPTRYFSFLGINDSSAANYISLRKLSNGAINFSIQDAASSGSSKIDAFPGVLSTGFHYLGIKYDASGMGLWLDGSKLGEDTSVTLASTLGSSIRIGSNAISTGQLNQPIEQVAFYQYAPSDAEMDAYTLTGPIAADNLLNFENPAFARTSTAWDPDTFASVSSGTARFSSKNGATGILIEENSTNLALQSQSFVTTPWYNVGSPVLTANHAPAPDGTLTATRFEVASGAGYADRRQNVSISSTTQKYTLSVWLKSTNGDSQKFRIIIADSTGVLCATYDLIPVSDTWTRFSKTGTCPNTGTGTIRLAPPSTGVGSDVLIWGAQLEAKTYATSYIPTTTATVTRNLEALSLASDNRLQASEGAVIMRAYVGHELATPGASKNYWLFSNAGYGAANLIAMGRDTGSYFAMLWDGSGSPVQTRVNWAGPTLSVGWHTIGMRWSASELSLWVDGEKKSGTASVTLPALMKDRLYIGGLNSSSSDAWGQPIDFVRTYWAAPDDDAMAIYTTGTAAANSTFSMEFNGSLGQ